MSNLFNLDPRLSDFSREQLMKLLSMILKEQAEIKTHVRSLRLHPSIERMFADEILQANVEIESLNEIAVHLSSAIYAKDQQVKVESN